MKARSSSIFVSLDSRCRRLSFSRGRCRRRLYGLRSEEESHYSVSLHPERVVRAPTSREVGHIKSPYVVSALAVTAIFFLLGFVASDSGAINLPKWSSPVIVNPSGPHRNQVTYAVSCPSATLCVVADGNGNVTLRRNGKWLPAHSVHAGGSFESVSCPSVTHCVAIGGAGNAVTFNGRTWSPAHRIGPDVSYHLSCPTTDFCAAVAGSDKPGGLNTIALLHGTKWSSVQTAASRAQPDLLLGVSCTSKQFCVAVNLDGTILTFNGVRWSSSDPSAPKGLISVSCVTSSFCLAVADSGLYTTYNGRTWSTPQSIPLFNLAFAYSVSCASPTYCVVLGISGYSVTWVSGHWSPPVRVFPGVGSAGVSVSCARTNACVAVNDKGLASYN